MLPSEPQRTFASPALTSSRRTPTDTDRSRTLPAFVADHVAAEVIRNSRTVPSESYIDIAQSNIRTRRDGTALQTHNPAILRCSLQALNAYISDLELAVCAVSDSRSSTKSRALTNSEQASTSILHS